MIIASKNGFKLDVTPNSWWNPLDVLDFIKTVWKLRTTNVYLDTSKWKGTYRSCE